MTADFLRILKNNVRICKKYFVDPQKVLDDPQKICGYLQNFWGAKYPHFLFWVVFVLGFDSKWNAKEGESHLTS